MASAGDGADVGLTHTVAVGERDIRVRVFGDPEAERTVISAHGGLVSGWDAAGYHDAATERGIRLLSPDRPGVGGSTAQPGRTILGWAREDVAAVLDDAGADSAVALGWSAGGQYALAAASALPHRISGAVVIAGALPLDDPENLSALNRMDRRLITLSRRVPATARTYFHVMRRMVRRRPEQVERMTARTLGAADAAIVHEAAEWYDRCMLEAMTQLDGAVEEYRVFAQPWGFAPADIAVAVTVFQGGADQLIRPEWGVRLADSLPAGTLREFPEDGHFVGIAHPDDVMDAVLAHSSGEAR